MLVGTYPFRSKQSKEFEIVDQIQNAPIPYPESKWSSISIKGKLFVQGLLNKDQKKRMTVKSALEHDWINSCSDSSSKCLLDRKGVSSQASAYPKLFS